MSECEVTKVNVPKFPEPELIVLTVEEAKTLLNMTKVFKMFAQTSNHKHLGKLIDLEKALTKRIEQAEGK